MDPYAINMMPRTFVSIHISLLHASMIVHMKDPFPELHSVTAYTRRLLWSLPAVAPWVEFMTRYHDYMMIGAPGWRGPRFQPHGAWVAVNTRLLRKEGGVRVEGDYY